MSLGLPSETEDQDDEDAPLKDGFHQAERTTSPIVLDLDGNGVSTKSLKDGTYFDHDGNGFAEKTGWVAKGDAILVRDANQDGQIKNGVEVFGNNSLLKNGQKAANGFETLSELDDNGDGKLDAQDAAWNSLKLWQDTNGNGQVDEGELFSLDDEGLLALNTGYTHTNHTDAQGQTHAQQGSFSYENGSTGKMEDLVFTTDTYHSKQTNYLDIDEAIRALPQIDGRGQIKSLWQSLATEKAAGENTLQTLIAQFANETDLTKRREIAVTLIYHWTGSANTAAGSRGSYIDARQMQTLEQMMGSPFVGVEGTRNPNSNAAAELKKAFENFANSVYSQLMQQTWLKDYYDAITYSWDAASQTLIPDLSGVKAQFIKEEAKDHGKARESFWLFIRHFFSENSISAEVLLAFKKTLKSYGDDIEITILNILKERKDILGTNSIDSLIGTYGDDTLIGWEGDDVLQGGYGKDTYIFKKGLS